MQLDAHAHARPRRGATADATAASRSRASAVSIEASSEPSFNITRSVSADGLSTAVVIQGKVTDVLDVQGLIRAYDPSLLERSDA